MYTRQVIANCRALSDALVKRSYKLVTGGTDNHLILWDLRPEGVTGSKMEKVCDLCHITLNKNAVVGDLSAMNPGGVRIGGYGRSCGVTVAECKASTDYRREASCMRIGGCT